MAYQDTHHGAAGDVIKSALAATGRFFSAIGKAFVSAAEANQRLKAVERLQAKSDVELEALGLRREDIVRHVFRDVLHT